MAAIVLLMLPAGQPAGAIGVGASIALSPRVGPPTTSVRVRGVGFGPQEVVDVAFDGTTLKTALTAHSGRFQTKFTIPAFAPPGFHEVEAIGETSGTVATAPYVVRTDWPQYHFVPDHRGLNPHENVLSPATVPGLVLKWRAPTGGRVKSSAALVGGVAYTAGEFDISHAFVEAFDAATGTMLWKTMLGGGDPWDIAVADGRVYVGTLLDHEIQALDAATGTELWDYTAFGAFEGVTAGPGGVVYAGTNEGELYAFRGATGQILWKRTGLGDVSFSTPALSAGIVYVGSWGSRSVYALDARTGANLWKTLLPDSTFSSPAVVGGLIYVGCFDHNVYALDATTGEIVWIAPTGDAVESSASVANGMVYIGSDDGTLYALDAQTGEQRWTFPTGLFFQQGSPVVANGVVYTADRTAYALDAVTGQELWTYQMGDVWNHAPSVADGVLYAGNFDGYLYAFHLPSLS